jgi:hypothetical protein
MSYPVVDYNVVPYIHMRSCGSLILDLFTSISSMSTKKNIRENWMDVNVL